jgi:signal transduction histidine kinase
MRQRIRAVLRRGVVMVTSPLVILFRSSLRAKLIGVIVFVQLCLMGLVTIVIEQRQSAIILEESRKRAVALASNLAALSTGYLLTYNFIKLKQTVEQVAAEADVVYAIVQLHNGRVAAYSGRSDLQGESLEDPVSQQAITAEKPLVQEITTPALAERGYDVAIPLFTPESTRKWGTIRLGFSLGRALRERRKTLKDLWLLNGMALALATSVAVLLAQCITKPIPQLVRGVNEVVKSNYQHTITVTSQDEIGHLAQRFTELQGALRDYVASLAQEKHHLEEANTLLEATQEQLIQSEKLATVGQWAAKIAHEVNNPLATIKTSLALVSKRLSKEDRRSKERLQIIEEEIGRIARIMQQLLDYSRPSSDIAVLQVNEVIRHLVQFVHSDLAARQIECRLELAEDLPPIRMSLDQLKQVLLNLIKNAQDAMPQGGTLLFKTTSQAGGLSICIADTGSGILPEHLRLVFEPFFTTKKHGKGMGLGLSVSANIIKISGGTIEVASEPGKGTVCRVFFPAYRPNIDEKHVPARGYAEGRGE